jgi:predicted DNA-binding transcriptional regulator AlpA
MQNVSTGTVAKRKPCPPIVRKQFGELHDDSLVKLRQILEEAVVPFGKSRVWALIADRRFPAPKRLPSDSVAWRVGDVRDWLAGTWVAPEVAPAAMTARKSGTSA